MKKLIILIPAVFLVATVWTQSPEKMSYQAVVRDAGSNLIINQAIGMQVSILQGSMDGSEVYVERQFPTTNSNGLITIEIGGENATIVSGVFADINWASGTYYIKSETDLNGGSNYTITGTSQILSVPYALHAKTAESITGTIAENDPLYRASQAVNVTSADITNLSNLSGANTGDQDLSGLATNQDLWDTAASVRSDIPDVSSFIESEMDPVYSLSQAANISSSDITKLDNLSGVNTGDQDLSIFALKSNVLELDHTTPFTPDGDYQPATKKYVDDNITSPITHSVGDFALGGIIFWVDETGQHGLVCQKEDHSTGVRWYAGTYAYTRATGNGPFSGEANTTIIIAAQAALGDDGSPSAALICNELQITEGGKTYGDWYLPSRAELDLMYQNRVTINNTATANGGSAFLALRYWSSTEYHNGVAYVFGFSSGASFTEDKFSTYRVRAIRAF